MDGGMTHSLQSFANKRASNRLHIGTRLTLVVSGLGVRRGRKANGFGGKTLNPHQWRIKKRVGLGGY
jgi:hypothetical protein